MPELKLLIDAVESSKFITKKKSKTLIGKIHTMTSPGQVAKLKRNNYVVKMCIRDRGCSEKTLKYYNATIQSMLDGIGKSIKYVVTDDIRCYLTEDVYKRQR